ncbi:uncharacterized protein KZ484_026090 [Pholidichthys leucotaenia]
MSELFMECVEEELEPWQKQVPQVQLVEEDDDDEPIFVGVLSNEQKDSSSSRPKPPPPQRSSPRKREVKKPAPTPGVVSSPVMVPLNIAGNPGNSTQPSLTTMTPQPVIVNNQGFIVTSPQLTNSREFITSLGAQYPPGTSITIVPAGQQQQLFQQVRPGTVIPGVVHRPQVQQISNNVVTLSNVQSPAVYSAPAAQLQPIRSNSQPSQTVSVLAKDNSKGGDQSLLKRTLTPQEKDGTAKLPRLDLAPPKVTLRVENGIVMRKCPNCEQSVPADNTFKYHFANCGKGGNAVPPPQNTNISKRIMLVSEFYYGTFAGDPKKKDAPKTNNTFKCQSCLKVLKNNIRFMNHMKHHLELEKQNSEIWESHTTCQHCYRQYMTPFQLQCHIESAHSPIESSTNCKICELAFVSEQFLLEHMKVNHKPGEMPYVCQVCNYRSSFFSDLESHFRMVHENTKDLLCPFCLKVLRTSHIYMQHYMKHQKKGIHRCGRCRLNFLTYKEKVEHRTLVHKTFRKPRGLEGLSPGTKVTIRASLTGKTATVPASPEQAGITIIAESSTPQTKPSVSGAGRAYTPQNKKQHSQATNHNLALVNLSASEGRHTCVECNSRVEHFFSHFPMVSHCGACKYKTSCKVSIGNHMIRFHSTIGKNRFLKKDQKKNPPAFKLTLVCLDCDLLVDASGADLMSKHLSDRPKHKCKVIQDKADIKDKDQAELGMEQPARVTPSLLSSPEKPKEMDGKAAETDPSGDAVVDGGDQPGSELMATAGDQEKSSTQTSGIQEPPGDGLKPLLPTTSSPLPAVDGVLNPCEESVANSESVDVSDQTPESVIVPEQATEEQCGSSRHWMYSQQQRLISQRRSQEEHRQQEARRLERERQLQGGLREEESFERKRYLRQVQEEIRERQIDSAIIKAEEERVNRERQLEQEERIAKELARIHHEKQKDEKMRQHIKENSLELRELESKLKLAYLNKERAAQIAEQEAVRFETIREEADYTRRMRSEQERAAVEQQKLEQKHHEEMVRYQRELEQQLMEREHKRQEAYEEFLKEKLMVDEIVRKIYEEDQMERQLKLEKVRATQQHIEEFKRQQEEWKRMEQERMAAENRRIMEFARQQQHIQEDRKSKSREKEKAKENLHKMLCEKIEEEQQQREELERIREELYLGKQEEANRQREIEELENKIRQRLIMQQTCQEQLAFKEMRRQAEKEEEEAFRKMMMAKFAEDDRIEQMNAQKRRMKQLEHKHEVEKMIEDRRRQHEADLELEAKERAIEQEREVLRRQIIEEERQKLLQRHATKLLGYFPKGLLREDDLQHFDEDFRRHFKTRQDDIFSEDGWEGDD